MHSDSRRRQSDSIRSVRTLKKLVSLFGRGKMLLIELWVGSRMESGDTGNDILPYKQYALRTLLDGNDAKLCRFP